MIRQIMLPLIVAYALVPDGAFAQATSEAPASPVPAATIAPSPSTPAAALVVDPAITVRAKEWLHRTQTDTIDRTQLDAQMNTLLTDTLFKQVSSQIGSLGDPTDFTFVDKKTISDSTAYFYRVSFKSASLYYIFAVDAGGKISGLRFVPKT